MIIDILYIRYENNTIGYKLKEELKMVNEIVKLKGEGLTKDQIIEKFKEKINN